MSTLAAEDRFFAIPKRALIFSLMLHACAPLLLLSLQNLDRSQFFPIPARKSEPLKESVQSFIQVDVVALPDELPTQQASIDTRLPVIDAPRAVPNPAKVKSEEVMETLAKEQKLAEAKRQESLEIKEKKRAKDQKLALKQMQEEAAREAALKAIAEQQGNVGRKKLSGNILSKGTALKGAIGTDKEKYTAYVMQAIKERFNIYPWQRSKRLVTVVQIQLFPNGRVKNRKVVKPSTDSTYDSSVLQAIDLSQPLPVPSDFSIVENGILIEFKPE